MKGSLIQSNFEYFDGLKSTTLQQKEKEICKIWNCIFVWKLWGRFVFVAAC